jgi:TRAP-type C4-dicarboxylate transport system permease small subunit
MIWYGSQLVVLTWDAILPSLGLPGGFDYLPIVAGGFLIVLFSLERMALRFSGVDVDKDLNVEDVPDVALAKEA